MRQDAQDNHNSIKSTAAELFATYGVEQVSMNQIAQTLRIGAGTLYRHFKDKGVLCFSLLEEDFDHLFTSFDHIQSSHRDKREQLNEMLTLMLEFKRDNEELLLCIEKHEMRSLFKETEYYQTLYRYFETIFASHDHPQFKTDMLLNALTTRSYQYQTHFRHIDLDTFKSNLMALFYPYS